MTQQVRVFGFIIPSEGTDERHLVLVEREVNPVTGTVLSLERGMLSSDPTTMLRDTWVDYEDFARSTFQEDPMTRQIVSHPDMKYICFDVMMNNMSGTSFENFAETFFTEQNPFSEYEISQQEFFNILEMNFDVNISDDLAELLNDGADPLILDNENSIMPDEPQIRPNGSQYVPLSINGVQDIALLRHLRAEGINPLLSGKPGTGKTAMVEAAFGEELITLVGNGDTTVANLIGSLAPKSDGGWEWHDGPLVKAMKEGRPFLMDEILRVPNETLSVLLGATDDRRRVDIQDDPTQEPVIAQEGFIVIGAYNPDTARGRMLDEALTSRFSAPIEVKTDLNIALRLGVPQEFVRISMIMANNGSRWVPEMRELLAMKRLVSSGLSMNFALSSLVSSTPAESRLNMQRAIQEVFGYNSEVKPLETQGEFSEFRF